MLNHWIDPTQCPTLAVLIESVAGPMLIEHQASICLEMDVDVDLPVPANTARTCDLIRALVGQSLVEMPEGGDLTITALETTHGVELEIADTGCDVGARSQSRPMAAGAIEASLHWKNCPQGGASVTVVFPPKNGDQQSLRRPMAA